QVVHAPRRRPNQRVPPPGAHRLPPRGARGLEAHARRAGQRVGAALRQPAERRVLRPRPLGRQAHEREGIPLGARAQRAQPPADAAIAEGRCSGALITYGSTARSSGIAVGTRERIAGEYVDQFEGLYGISTVGLYALVAQRHMHVFGTTSAQLAEIAVACRRHAGLNPVALYREPITVDDVVKSPMISSPLHLLDCCVITDGGGLSSNQPGMRGIFLVVEAVKQLRGECGDRQVKDCRVALVHGTGGTLGTRHSGATLILGRA